ncbi:hypothetical protein SCHPADRAFT_901505 [Schizopora paradoxa]|uniref:Uncharacterized protein n=1 Tax=Schizopora paradoxa TaxID=27342 RepID=A0A0H2S412_9AGAM|nr:hypothetical protein SCHPADRAFT_901505 [Schizopora paradoxa]
MSGVSTLTSLISDMHFVDYEMGQRRRLECTTIEYITPDATWTGLTIPFSNDSEI